MSSQKRFRFRMKQTTQFEGAVNMPIVVNLDVMMAKRRISSGDLAAAIGLSQANLSILKTGKARAIRFSTLAAICKVLECQPGDILEYENPNDERKVFGDG